MTVHFPPIADRSSSPSFIFVNYIATCFLEFTVSVVYKYMYIPKVSI